MKLGYVTLFVDDVATAVKFYTEAFGMETRFIHDSGEWTELQTGATRLSFASRNAIEAGPLSPAEPSPCFCITLVTDDVPAAFARAVDRGARPIAEPVVKPWGQTVAYVGSPEGFIVELGTPIGS